MNNNHKPLRVSMLALLLTCVISILSFQSGLAQDEITSDDAQQQTSPTDILCGPTRFVGGNITEDTYWDPGYVYVLNSSVVVQPGVTLRVVANVVKAKPGTSITVNGKLIVLGTESSPRYFTSWKDDTLCGDTNGDGAASVPVTNDWAFIVFGSSSDPTSIVQRAVIRYGGYSGVYGGAIRLFNSSPTLDHITFFKNYRNAVEIRGNSTWSLTNTTVIHWLPDVINIAADQTLTIAPDVKIKGGGGISVTSRNSKLIANGTEAAPIIFTSERDDTVCGVGAANEPVCDTNNDGSASVPAVGQQGGIYFGPDSNASSSVQRVAMRYGGISLSNITPILDHITFYKCSINAVVIAAGNWTTHTWDNTSLVYWVNGSITLNPESTLTIAPGVKVKLNNGASINVTGANSKLVVNGTEANPVTFTSSRDDTICAIGAANEPICDSNNDGAASVPVTNDWGFIVFGSSSDPTSIVQRAVIRYGGYSGVYGGAIRLFNSSPTLDHITFFKNYRNAVEIRGNSTWSLTNTTVIHWLPDVINIAADQTLTIAPDVKIKGGGGISVTSRNSKLIANGTEAAPIIFTSERDDTVCGVGAANEPVCDTNNDGSASVPAVGQQGGIYFGPDSNASSSVQRVAMRYGGISLSNITPILDHITFYKCSINAVVIAAGNWTTHTWDNTSLVYWVNGSITLNPESTLTIAPGVKVKLNNGASINVTGANSKLVVNGTEANPVTFTSSRDDTICAIGAANEPICDSNNDGAASVPVTNDWAFIVFGSSSDPTSIVQRAVIRYGGYSGVYGGAIRLFNSSPTLDHITFFKNYRNAVEIRGNSTWSLTNTTVIHWLPDVINIAADQTLTIAPDVKIKGGGGISVTSRNSKLIANGTEAAPIIFTSERDDTVCGVGAANEPVCDTNNDGSASVPAVGQQGGIYFGPDSNASSSVQRVAMRYGGISLSNITPILDHITFYKCSINAVVIAAGNWTTHTWDNTSLVYWVNGSITLNPESTLTIAPGVKVKLNNGASINVTGANSKLVVNGTEANPVTFTSSRDDTICAIGAANEPICDSNNDGAASVPVTNDWGFIVFGSSSDPTSIVQRAVIRYGGYSGVYGGAIRLFNSSPTISYVKFSHNYRGLDTLQGARPVLVCNDFRNNSAGGIHNAQPSTIVTAENQWWNSSSGPTHTFNPGGTGERVSDGVDFTPWATVPCVPGEDPLAWTFMFYLDGDNNLDSNYQGVFNQLETMANNTAINLIVLWDRVGAGNSAYYRVKYDTNLWQQVSYTQGVDVWNQGELNMGDGATLRDFVLWTRARFPAQRYALFISDHGTGLNGTAKDVTSSSDWITMRELSDALSAATTNGSNKLDVLFADSCLMGMLETSYQIRNYVGFLVASENQSWIPPWGSSQPYPRYLTGVSASTTPEELARKIVTGYASWLDQTYPGQYGYTMSAVELSRIDQLVTATGDLATALRTGVATYGSSIAAARTAAQKFDSNDNGVISTDDEYIDLYDFAVQIRQRILTPDIQSLAQAVMTAVDVFVVDGAEVHRSGSLRYPGLDNGHGVSIFLPRGDFKRSFYSGSSLDFAADATWGVLDGLTFGETTGPGWGSMLVNYVEQQTPGAPDNPAPPALAQPVGTPGGGMVHMPLIIRNR